MAETPGGEARPLINENPELQSYYQSLESRVGYRLVLGGTRHFGYWYVRMLFIASPGSKHHFEVLGWRLRGSGLLPGTSSGRMALRSSSGDSYGMAPAYGFPLVVRALPAVTHPVLWWTACSHGWKAALHSGGA